MVAAILGKKIGMTQVYDERGVLHPVTVVQAGPCTVLQVKTDDTDGYNAVQLGFEDMRAHRAGKPMVGHAAKAKSKPKRFIKEVRLAEAPADISLGQQVTVDEFAEVVFVDVIGTTKGKGFAGVMKRHNFSGLSASHGVERKHRSPGSIGSHSSNAGLAGRIRKGKKMSGHMGDVRCTSRNHRLVGIEKENNLLLIQGSVPGANGGFVYIRVSKTARLPKAAS
jgi:large subunit ribosomal protein L3